MRTADGVSISRPSSERNFRLVFGVDVEHIDVQVPSGSHVDVRRSSVAEVSGMHNDVDVKSQDGHIALSDIQGNVVAHSDDGRIEAKNVTGSSLVMSTDDGSVHLRDVSANSLEAKTSDGRIEGKNLTITGAAPRARLHTDDGSVLISGTFAPRGSYDISTNDGRIETTVGANSDMTIAVSTDSGRIYVDGSSFGDGDSTTHTVRLGSGSGAMRLATHDGSIHISTNGVL